MIDQQPRAYAHTPSSNRIAQPRAAITLILIQLDKQIQPSILRTVKLRPESERFWHNHGSLNIQAW